jgi:hypothetical protein
MRDRSPFFFIHVYKNLGSTIYSQFPENYNQRFYGKKSLNQWKFENKSTMRTPFDSSLNSYLNGKTPFAVDHLDLDSCYEIGILDDFDFKWREFIAIIRNPVDRFISICNFEKRSPDDLLNDDTKRDVSQVKPLKTKKKINLTLIQMERPELIKSYFKKFNINIDLEIRLNQSDKIYTKEDLTIDQLKKYELRFEKDYQLYNQLIENDGIIKNFNF